jgi:hypothetical protein
MLGIFWVSNGLMALWLFSTLGVWANMEQAVTEAEKVGQGLGIAIGLGVIFSIWACIALVTGLLTYMTRGTKEIIELEG